MTISSSRSHQTHHHHHHPPISTPPIVASSTLHQPNVPKITYSLKLIQQPLHARACGFGAKSSADRRPTDPPPILQLRIFQNDTQDCTFSYSSSFFLFATIEPAASNAVTPSEPSQTSLPSTPPSPCSSLPNSPASSLSTSPSSFAPNLASALTGTFVSGLVYLDRPVQAGYFVFPDLSVRHEGEYHLCFSLYEVVKSSTSSSTPAHVAFRLQLKSAPFTVYSAKRFPGLAQSTPLSRLIAEQGCRVRIRRVPRARRPHHSTTYATTSTAVHQANNCNSSGLPSNGLTAPPPTNGLSYHSIQPPSSPPAPMRTPYYSPVQYPPPLIRLSQFVVPPPKISATVNVDVESDPDFQMDMNMDLSLDSAFMNDLTDSITANTPCQKRKFHETFADEEDEKVQRQQLLHNNSHTFVHTSQGHGTARNSVCVSSRGSPGMLGNFLPSSIATPLSTTNQIITVHKSPARTNANTEFEQVHRLGRKTHEDHDTAVTDGLHQAYPDYKFTRTYRSDVPDEVCCTSKEVPSMMAYTMTRMHCGETFPDINFTGDRVEKFGQGEHARSKSRVMLPTYISEMSLASNSNVKNLAVTYRRADGTQCLSCIPADIQ